MLTTFKILFCCFSFGSIVKIFKGMENYAILFFNFLTICYPSQIFACKSWLLRDENNPIRLIFYNTSCSLKNLSKMIFFFDKMIAPEYRYRLKRSNLAKNSSDKTNCWSNVSHNRLSYDVTCWNMRKLLTHDVSK